MSESIRIRARVLLTPLVALLVAVACASSASYDDGPASGVASAGSAGARTNYDSALPSSPDGGASAASAAPENNAGASGLAEGGAPGAGSAASSALTNVGSGVAVSYVADLESYWQVPRLTAQASGDATLTLSADKKTLSYHLTQTVADAAEAQIHFGGAGEDGARLYALVPLSADMTGVISLTGVNDVANLEAGRLYISVRSLADAGVQIRGQILHPHETLYVAQLAPSRDAPLSEDASSGTAQLIVAANKLSFRYHLQSTIFAPTSAHVGNGLASAEGRVIHRFVPARVVEGDATFGDGEQNDLARGRWYAALQASAAYGDELRGQFIQPGETLYSVELADSNESPAVESGATGNGQFILSADRTLLRYELALFGLDPTFVQIAKGAVGVTGPVVYPLTLASGYSSTPNATAGVAGVRAVTPEDRADLDAANWYVNARAAAFPTGAARGQMVRAAP